MTPERFIEILRDENDEIETIFPEGKDNALAGLNLIAKYLPANGVEGASHDTIYSVSAEEITEAGITEEDARQLAEWNWGYDKDIDTLYCFV